MAKGKICYFYGEPATTREHIPPKMLFKWSDCNRITVPSCSEHNISRSNKDQAIIAGMLKALHEGNRNLPKDVQKAISNEKETSTFETTKNTAKILPLFNNPTADLAHISDVAYTTYDPSIWIVQITAGLVFDAARIHDSSIKWNDALLFSSNWISGSKQGLDVETGMALVRSKWETTIILEELQWLDGWSAYPRPYPHDIYRFYVHFFDKFIFFKHVFYNNFTWYIVFECSEAIRQPLGNKVLEANGI